MTEACPYCGDDYLVDVLEHWPEEHAWMFDACCEGSQAEALDFAETDPKGFARWYERQTGLKARRSYVSDSEFCLRLDFGLQLDTIPQKEAKAFVREHHRHCPPPAGWRWGHAVYNGHTLVAVAMVGRPVARALDKDKVVEVNRLCVDPSLDTELVWNACSMLYGAAAREAKKRGFETIITYTLETESGGTLKASGWTPTTKTKGGSWDTPARRRTDKTSTCRKQRWERTFRQRRHR
jgi:hypothetical protein